mgnify:CR=1 FL=1
MSSGVQFIMNQAGRFPLLTAEEELIYSRQVQRWLQWENIDPAMLTDQQRRDIKTGKRAYQRFFNANLRLVISVSKKLTRSCRFLSMEDLFSEGCIGLGTGIKKFDPERGYKFSTYAYWWIWQSLTRAISTQERTIKLPVDFADVYSKCSTFILESIRTKGIRPTIEQCAAHCGVTVERMELLMQHSRGVASLEAQVRSDEDSSQLADFVICPKRSPEDAATYKQVWEAVEEARKKTRLHTPRFSALTSQRWRWIREVMA